MYIINIGQSAYSQHLKITKGQETNTDVSADKKIPAKWEPKGKRMLQLHLTDGTQSIQAVEDILVPELNLDLIPGTKMLVKGPLECRRGILMLKPANVELLGGEVSDLVDSNAPENVLARIIGKAENPNPVYGSYGVQTANIEADQHDEGKPSPTTCTPLWIHLFRFRLGIAYSVSSLCGIEIPFYRYPLRVVGDS